LWRAACVSSDEIIKGMCIILPIRLMVLTPWKGVSTRIHGI